MPDGQKVPDPKGSKVPVGQVTPDMKGSKVPEGSNVVWRYFGGKELNVKQKIEIFFQSGNAIVTHW